MAQDEIGVGIIGTGFGVRVQLPLWQHTPGARVTAVCSHDAGRARQVADRFGLSHAVTDYGELAALPDVDLVSVVTSPDLHYPGAMAAIEAGKHVLCEKPFALDEAQAREMWQAAEAKGVAHMVNFEFRTTPARARMREMIQDGYLGSLNHVHTTSFGNFVHWTEGRTASWWYGAKTGGGWLGASGSHTLDAMRWLFGEIVAVNATLETFAKEHKPIDQPDHIVADADDTFFLTLRFENGALGAFLSSAAAPTGTGAMRLEAHGADGTLVLDGDRLSGGKEGRGPGRGRGRGASRPARRRRSALQAILRLDEPHRGRALEGREDRARASRTDGGASGSWMPPGPLPKPGGGSSAAEPALAAQRDRDHPPL